MIPLAEIVDVNQLLRVVVAALIAGIGISIAFSLVIFGFTRAGEHRDQTRRASAGAHALLGGLGLAVCLGAIAFGITVMLSK